MYTQCPCPYEGNRYNVHVQSSPLRPRQPHSEFGRSGLGVPLRSGRVMDDVVPRIPEAAVRTSVNGDSRMSWREHDAGTLSRIGRWKENPRFGMVPLTNVQLRSRQGREDGVTTWWSTTASTPRAALRASCYLSKHCQSECLLRSTAIKDWGEPRMRTICLIRREMETTVADTKTNGTSSTLASGS